MLYLGFSSDQPLENVVSTVNGFKEKSLFTELDAKDVYSITIPNSGFNEFIVEIKGQVNTPGKYLVNSTTTLNDLYKIAGGLKKSASASGVVFVRESVKEKEILALKNAKKILSDSYISNLNNPLGSQQALTEISLLLS